MPREAHLFDLTDRQPPEYRPLAPIIIKGAEIEAEVERLARADMVSNRRTAVVHPGLIGNLALMPACTVSVNVLLPGESTAPHRHNSSVVNFCLRGSGSSLIA